MERCPRFAHPSEEEFARLLDFYHVHWLYEPCAFPISRDACGLVKEWFTPDFYLPEYEMFVELTTQDQKLMSRKNRKIRLLRETYPDINVKLFTKRDIDRVFASRIAC